jgi:hypothetical protein
MARPILLRWRGGETTTSTEKIMLTLASGQMNRQGFTEWLNQHVKAAGSFEGV